MEILIDATLDALKDTLYLLPFLFLTYVVMEWLETKTESFSRQRIETAGKLGPAVGSLCGLVPQCGFSATAATLYAGRVITRGTLIAVFLATSDEMLPIFIAKAVPIDQILGLLGVKFAIGVVAGYAIDAFLTLTNRKSKQNRISQLCAEAHCDCSAQDDHHHDFDGQCNHDNIRGSGAVRILRSALVHTLQVILFVFAITLLLSLAISIIGEDSLSSIFKQNEWQSVIVSAIFGLIPNCAASVAIADLWADGVLGYGAMLSGLLTSAGVGILVLLRTNKEPKRNAVILLTLVLISIACGYIATIFVG